VRISIYLCLLGSPLLGRQLRHHLPPAAAVKTMTALALGAATATVWGLVLLAGARLGRTGEAVILLDTNPVQVDTTDPVPRWFGAAAILLLAVAAARTARVLWVRHTVTRLGARVGGPAPPGQLVVFTAIEPHAYAIPGRRGMPGRIAVSTAMLRALDAGERRALFAHEQAHPRHRHHRYQAAASIAGALNPLLGGLRAEIDFQIERWADEAAADSTGRTVTARSLARAALATLHPSAPLPRLGFTRHAVPGRVRACSRHRSRSGRPR
jgi:Zn-dependent protease with chaperone function